MEEAQTDVFPELLDDRETKASKFEADISSAFFLKMFLENCCDHDTNNFQNAKKNRSGNSALQLSSDDLYCFEMRFIPEL